MYMITDGNLYIKRGLNGRYVGASKSLGDVYDDKDKAINVLTNCIEKSQRGKYHIIEVGETKYVAVKNEIQKLSNELSDVDMEISDINHYIEFNELNAYEGWLAYKMLNIRYKKRRVIKDKLFILKRMSDCKLNSREVSELVDSVGLLSTREYVPRKLDNLFK